jgi:D-glycero-alpha-D-manno-heptose-7-phosphate kinase
MIDMIVSSCPLRISLVGGSTDNPKFIEKYGKGAVISFPSTLRTYVTIHQDIFGTNSIENNYNINYSKRETVKKVSDIQNELVRNCFEYLDVEHINCSLTSDIYSAGSGLAASSSYMQALIKSIYIWRDKNITEFEVCKIAEEIERKTNVLVGQQDFYGSMGGLKRLNFFKKSDPEIKYLSTKIFDSFDINLIYTGILRSSTKVLESLDIDKSLPLLNDVEDLESAINDCDIEKFNFVMRRSWGTKKLTSKMICKNETLSNLDNKLKNDRKVLSHKLCGAGNGGYFLVFSEKGSNLDFDYEMMKPIGISETGLKYSNLKNEFTKL